MAKRGFVLTDKDNNTYRLIAHNFSEAVSKVVSEHGITETDIINATSSKSISPVSLG